MADQINQSVSSQHPPIPIFTVENYDYWCVKMQTFFQSEGLWSFVKNGYEEPDPETPLSQGEKQKLEETKRKDSRALFLIQQALSDDLFPRIISSHLKVQSISPLKRENGKKDHYTL